ncbi:MAG: hypothetical protein ABIA83_01500 [Patescibacteria group bacterium]
MVILAPLLLWNARWVINTWWKHRDEFPASQVREQVEEPKQTMPYVQLCFQAVPGSDQSVVLDNVNMVHVSTSGVVAIESVPLALSSEGGSWFCGELYLKVGVVHGFVLWRDQNPAFAAMWARYYKGESKDYNLDRYNQEIVCEPDRCRFVIDVGFYPPRESNIITIGMPQGDFVPLWQDPVSVPWAER